jgi:hypothetical protein
MTRARRGRQGGREFWPVFVLDGFGRIWSVKEHVDVSGGICRWLFLLEIVFGTWRRWTGTPGAM